MQTLGSQTTTLQPAQSITADKETPLLVQLAQKYPQVSPGHLDILYRCKSLLAEKQSLGRILPGK